MGFEDEAEQSFGRRCRQSNGRTKQTCELTSSIVPQGTSFHCWVDLSLTGTGKNPLTVSSAVLERIASEAAARGRRPAGSQRFDDSPRLLRLVDHHYLTIHRNIRASLAGCR
jgi:hypothetical protein